MFPDGGEADSRVPTREGGWRLWSRAREDGDYVYKREGLCALTKISARRQYFFWKQNMYCLFGVD